jgi:protein-tyrosine phosphatase
MVASTNKTLLKSLGITHILSVCDGAVPKFAKEFTYKIIPIYDVPTARLAPHFGECIKFIKEAIDAGGKVLVHCWAGVSRSATITIAYMMRIHNMTLGDAFNFVKSKRAIIFPNHGFMG